MPDTARSGCVACRVVAGELRPVGGVVWRGDGLTAHGPADASPIPGWLVVTSDRHACALDDLGGPELSALGPVIARLMSAQRRALGAEHVYLLVPGEGPEHFQVHLVPRFADTPARLRGPGCFAWRAADALPAWRVVAAAEGIRRVLARA